MLARDDQFFFALVYLLPLVPAVALIVALGRAGFVANVRGTLAGLGIQAGGGFAAYVVLVLLLAFVRNQVAPSPPASIAEFYIKVSGEQDDVAKFLSTEARNLQLLLFHKGVPVTRLSDFFISKTGLITVTDSIDPSLLANREAIDLQLDGPSTAKLVTLKTQAGKRMHAQIKIEGDPDRVRVLLDAQEITYDSDYEGVRVRHIMLLTNDGDIPTSTLEFGTTQSVRPFERYRSVIRKLTSRGDIELASGIAASWNRGSLVNRTADEIAPGYDRSWDQLQNTGNSIGRIERGSWGLNTEESLTKNGSLELIWGLSPRIKGIPDGLRKDQILVYLVEYKVSDSGRLIVKNDRDETGTLTRYETDRLLLLMRSSKVKLSLDRDAWSMTLSGDRRPEEGVLDPPGDKARLLHVEKIPRLTSAGIPVRFD